MTVRKRFTVDHARAALRALGRRLPPKATLRDLARGMTVELEHGDVARGDPRVTARIALAHLRERPDYYDLLAEMERAPRTRNPAAPVVQRKRFREAAAQGRVDVDWIDGWSSDATPPPYSLAEGWSLSLYRGARRTRQRSNVEYGRASFVWSPARRGRPAGWQRSIYADDIWMGDVEPESGAVMITHRTRLGHGLVRVAPPTGGLAMPDYLRLLEMAEIALHPGRHR